MTTLYHPNMRETFIEVEDDRVSAFVAQGWRKTPRPKKKDELDSSAPAPSTPTGEANSKETLSE